jgi:head-tail adaptor
MQAGRLSDLLIFEKKIRTPNALNQQIITWSSSAAQGTFTEWAEVTRQSETAARFVIRYKEGITPDSHRITWDGVVWLIVSVVHDRRRTMTIIESDFSSMVEVTHLQSDTRDFIDGLPVINE